MAATTTTLDIIAGIKDLLVEAHADLYFDEQMVRFCQAYKVIFENSTILTMSDSFKTTVGTKFFICLTDSNDFICFIPDMIHHYVLLHNENIEIAFDNENEFMTWNDEQQMEFIVAHPFLLSLPRMFDYMTLKIAYNIKHKNRLWWVEKLALICNVPHCFA